MSTTLSLLEKKEIIKVLEVGLATHKRWELDSPVILEAVVETLVELLTNEIKQRDAALRSVFTLIDAEQFTEALTQIAVLEQCLGEHDSELVLARSLITFLKNP